LETKTFKEFFPQQQTQIDVLTTNLDATRDGIKHDMIKQGDKLKTQLKQAFDLISNMSAEIGVLNDSATSQKNKKAPPPTLDTK